MHSTIRMGAAAALLLASGLAADAQAPNADGVRAMTFFVTSAGPGRGADLGGLAGADAHCQSLAAAAGAGGRTWRAYLSTSNPPAHARDRIGTGPWQNFSGAVIANSIAELHGETNNLTKQTAVTERGASVNGRGDTPNTHDILTAARRTAPLSPAPRT